MKVYKSSESNIFRIFESQKEPSLWIEKFFDQVKFIFSVQKDSVNQVRIF